MTKTKYGTLYLIPTPIGNLSDMTYRAVETLKIADIIYAEDTRTSGILLKHYNINTPQKSYHKFNERERCEQIITALQEGKNIAIISDAGTPGISDPSNIIVQEVIQNGMEVCALPGATAFVPALVASGFETERFIFLGFLPKKKKDRERILCITGSAGVSPVFKGEKTVICRRDPCAPSDSIPLIFYESPHRLHDFLKEIKKYFGNADISISREISKIHETYYRGKLNDILDNFKDITLKGEFVIVVKPESKEINETELILERYISKYKEKSISEASRLIALELGIKKNTVYEVLIKCT